VLSGVIEKNITKKMMEVLFVSYLITSYFSKSNTDYYILCVFVVGLPVCSYAIFKNITKKPGDAVSTVIYNKASPFSSSLPSAHPFGHHYLLSSIYCITHFYHIPSYISTLRAKLTTFRIAI